MLAQTTMRTSSTRSSSATRNSRPRATQQRKSAETEAALKREIEQIGADRRKLNQALIDTAARLRDVETKIAATEARLKPLDDNERSIRKSLDGRRAVIGEVLAALAAHRPPAAAGLDRQPGGRAAIGAHRHGARRGAAGNAP